MPKSLAVARYAYIFCHASSKKYPTQSASLIFLQFLSSVHVETDNPDRKDPLHKVFKSRYQKEVRFTPDSIVITNNKGTRIELTDAEGIHIVSAHSIMLETAEDLTIASDAVSLIVAGDSFVNFRQIGTSLQLDNGISFIGGNLKIQ
ncbi:hypothetical protein C804_04792 [Lachnospiraceae bacterium A4]|jgi:hypothetical protein|nr:hypothetical protein C804_04792 [Lachnospiraceae bacterium A4]